MGEKETVGVRGGDGTEFALRSLQVTVCAHVCVCGMKQADNWMAAWSPGHPAAVGKASRGQCRALASVLQNLNVLALSKQMHNVISR